MRYAILVAVLAAPSIASAETCYPKDNSARILSSPSPNDIHPDWTGESYVGTSWTFVVQGSAEDGTGKYLKGNLMSPRGGLVNANVYILRREWECE
ncbi:UNVERIFIED_ORG: hypothetical protein GGE44_004109 [Rhizobium esperanzae]